MSGCAHKNTTRSGCYEYCEDCGAVRKQIGINQWDEWHACNSCHLPDHAHEWSMLELEDEIHRKQIE